jgi:hypothetical protein
LLESAQEIANRLSSSNAATLRQTSRASARADEIQTAESGAASYSFFEDKQLIAKATATVLKGEG